ncbi:site-specific integrase [Chryseobacterium sp. RP-3-3]|uniref:Site-specific integrase n=1 Tax=Chryseobacterium antibioticum TaxID=2728847 RepID=A0A7Y0AQC3_9FLAO|nr:phage integrase SAM-like domain-containing protein [Chryseobacterium antibioticum]NML71544.1 site-specific integrase [Chryseobacterium antibioticum]
MREEETVTCESLKNKLLGRTEKQRMLIPIFQDHNNRMEKLIGKEFAKGTLTHYKTSLSHTEEFLVWKYNNSDINIRRINYAFLNDFELFLRTEKSCKNNSSVKYIKNLGKIIRICIANGWIEKDPFINYHSKFKEVTRVFLNELEIEAVFSKDFKNEGLSLVRDIFLFSCFTGFMIFLRDCNTKTLTTFNP